MGSTGCALFFGAESMSTANTSLMTAREFLALPEDGKQRWLIDGQLREKDEAVTYRNRFHAWVEARIAFLLHLWLQDQPEPRGAVHSGEVGCLLGRDPDTVVGIDVAFFSPETMAKQSDTTTIVEGAPVLAVEILSPSDKVEEINEKIAVYLAGGVELVWIVDPYIRTVQVHRPARGPAMFNVEQTFDGGDALPGLTIPVADLFPKQ
jgi:Uma2 family endonuclease